MKKLTLIVFVITALNGSCISQNYVPFPESGATWRVDKASCVYCTADMVNCICSKFQYTLQGDTTVGNYGYKKIHREWQDIDEFEFTDSGYLGAIRQDIPNKKVYYLMPNTSIDTLLYDFDLAVGDTVPISYVFEFPDLVVEEIDSILIGSNYHKIYSIHGIGDKLIEGIGSTAGLIETMFVFEVYHLLRCFSLSSGYQHVFPGAQNCDIITDIAEIKKIDISIYPNPGNSQFTLQSPEKITSLSIYDITGREIKAGTLSVAEGQTTLDVSHLQQGVYVFIVNGSTVKKVIKE